MRRAGTTMVSDSGHRGQLGQYPAAVYLEATPGCTGWEHQTIQADWTKGHSLCTQKIRKSGKTRLERVRSCPPAAEDRNSWDDRKRPEANWRPQRKLF